jgi:hypothetical protein
MSPLFHKSLPFLPEGMVAAEVEILNGPSSDHAEMRARIISMLRGSYSGTEIRLAPRIIMSCNGWARSGDRGIVVGTVISSSETELVIDPMWAPSQREIDSRLPLFPELMKLSPL